MTATVAMVQSSDVTHVSLMATLMNNNQFLDQSHGALVTVIPYNFHVLLQLQVVVSVRHLVSSMIHSHVNLSLFDLLPYLPHKSPHKQTF